MNTELKKNNSRSWVWVVSLAYLFVIGCNQSLSPEAAQLKAKSPDQYEKIVGATNVELEHMMSMLVVSDGDSTVMDDAINQLSRAAEASGQSPFSSEKISEMRESMLLMRDVIKQELKSRGL